MYDAPDLDLNQQVYEWCARIFARVHSLLNIRIKMHHEQGLIDSGNIFLFNHFSRIETFIPQYLIYKKTGALCRSVAAATNSASIPYSANRRDCHVSIK